MNKTVDYYNKNAKAFIDRTINVEIAGERNSFLSYIPKEGHIIDAGCGSGRDSLYFLEQGYIVLSFDASEEMVKFSSELTGQSTIHATFQDIELKDESYDGIWACASLLHVDKKEIAFVVAKMYEALKSNGVFYMALKYGDGDYVKEGRNFYIYNEDTVESVLDDINGYEILEKSITQDGRENLKHQKWINLTIRKK